MEKKAYELVQNLNLSYRKITWGILDFTFNDSLWLPSLLVNNALHTNYIIVYILIFYLRVKTYKIKTFYFSSDVRERTKSKKRAL